MNCQNHMDVPATAYCRACGKPVCDECRRDAFGTVYCAEHTPAPAGQTPPAPGPGAPPYPMGTQPIGAPPMGAPQMSYAYADVSPGLALFLGLIPGVGAIYNGQYAKGMVHAVVWGVLMSIANSRAANGLEPIFVMGVIAWMAYMAFEAYHTARKRRMGEPVDEYSSLIDMRGRHNVPVAGILLIVLGILLLLHTLELLDFEYVVRYWPVLLIAAGAYLLYGRFTGHDSPKEMGHER
ncbi:MAG TPA: B-box zinc finger protein [Candidatus Acidoferrales bacterium]|jgi:hypothetical protein|nr:B-box zinc finger protein [Candidatus Acidoferrales bacterium]